MSDMKDRENAFENKFAHDEKMSFGHGSPHFQTIWSMGG